MKISEVEWGPVLKASAKEYSKDDVPGLAAEMAYWIVFSLFPFFAFLAFVLGIAGRVIGTDVLARTVEENVLATLPGGTREAVRGPLETLLTTGGGALSVGAIISAVLALNSASTAVLTIMKAFNRAYGVEETRNFIAVRLTALGLTVVLGILLVGGALFLSLGGAVAGIVADFGTVGQVVFFIVRLIAAILGITLALAILYWKGPNLSLQFQWITPGSLIATITLLVLSGLFGIYVNVTGGDAYAQTYGTLAGIILFLFFLRLASTVVLLGAEFNAETAKRHDPEAIRDKISDPRKQLPGKQPMPASQALRQAGVSREQIAQSNAASAAKLTQGGGSPATAAMHAQAEGGASQDAPSATTSSTPGLTGGVLDNPDVQEKLRAIRDRPYVSAEERARRELSRLPAPERARRARATLTAFGVSTATAIGGVLLGSVRRRVTR